MGLFYCFGSLDINMFALVLFSRPLCFLYGQNLSGKGSSGAVDFCSFSPGPLNFPIKQCLSTQKELFCRKLHIIHGMYCKCHHLKQLEQGAGAKRKWPGDYVGHRKLFCKKIFWESEKYQVCTVCTCRAKITITSQSWPVVEF